MRTVQIRSCFPQDVTILSNEFLDRFMPEANGEFVKIYLYLLRASESSGFALALSAVADALHCTDMDVQRALRYWEDKGVLRIKAAAGGEISEIAFVNFCNPEVWEGASSEETETQMHLPLTAPKESPRPARQGAMRVPAGVRNDLSKKEEVQQLFFNAEQYLGRPLTKTDTDSFIYFLHDCGFSVDLLEYLVEYCVSLGHKSIRYIKEVGFSWQEDGVQTVAEAKARTGTYKQPYFNIFKALGIKNHSVTEAEQLFMDRWLNEYNFSEDVITLACERTILATGKPSFPYTEGILKSWHDAGVQRLEDISLLDKKHSANTEGAAKKVRKSGRGTPGGFDFSEQRSYDYTELEKRLLQKSNQTE